MLSLSKISQLIIVLLTGITLMASQQEPTLVGQSQALNREISNYVQSLFHSWNQAIKVTRTTRWISRTANVTTFCASIYAVWQTLGACRHDTITASCRNNLTLITTSAAAKAFSIWFDQYLQYKIRDLYTRSALRQLESDASQVISTHQAAHTPISCTPATSLADLLDQYAQEDWSAEHRALINCAKVADSQRLMSSLNEYRDNIQHFLHDLPSST